MISTSIGSTCSTCSTCDSRMTLPEENGSVKAAPKCCKPTQHLTQHLAVTLAASLPEERGTQTLQNQASAASAASAVKRSPHSALCSCLKCRPNQPRWESPYGKPTYHACQNRGGQCGATGKWFEMQTDREDRVYCDGCAGLRPLREEEQCPQCKRAWSTSDATGLPYCAACEEAAFKAMKSRRRKAVARTGVVSQMALSFAEAG